MTTSESWYSNLLLEPSEWATWRSTYCFYPDDHPKRAKVWRELIDEIGVLSRTFGLWDAFGLISGCRPWWYTGLTEAETTEVVATVAAYLEGKGIAARVRVSRTSHGVIMLREDETQTRDQCATIVRAVRAFPAEMTGPRPTIPDRERTSARRGYR